jgi:hypothetical protein
MPLFTAENLYRKVDCGCIYSIQYFLRGYTKESLNLHIACDNHEENEQQKEILHILYNEVIKDSSSWISEKKYDELLLNEFEKIKDDLYLFNKIYNENINKI